MKSFTVAVVGAGNMGRALIGGWLKSKLLKPAAVRATALRPETLRALKKLRVAASTDNRTAVRGASAVVLAVKPQKMGAVLDELKGAVTAGQLVISVAAGVTTGTIESVLGAGVPVVRAMPNTPALVGAGAMAFALGRRATAAHERTARKLLSAAGVVWKVEEAWMDAVTALSGSGPAYVFHLAEALAAAGVKIGLPKDLAEALARQTVYGAGLLLNRSTEPPAALRGRVTSPGGTTAAALAVMAEAGIDQIYERALAAASRRSRELSELNARRDA